mmetsp:Transcript_7635/g.18209  ORF Transcript_7635/g.18209 Transcript_7635/m.18209 type:complete len:106 (-) Transcript_7635:540-857(-)
MCSSTELRLQLLLLLLNLKLLPMQLLLQLLNLVLLRWLTASLSALRLAQVTPDGIAESQIQPVFSFSYVLLQGLLARPCSRRARARRPEEGPSQGSKLLRLCMPS